MIEEVKSNCKFLSIALALLLSGCFFIAVDSIVHGRYTGGCNTLWGWLGVIFVCLSFFIPYAMQDSEDAKKEREKYERRNAKQN